MSNKARLTIVRPHYSDGRKKIAITVVDVSSQLQFLEIQLDLDAFAECVTGLGDVHCDATYRGLDKVGKQVENKEIVFEMPDVSWKSKNETARKLGEKATPKGWTCSAYFGSQDSFFTKGGKQYARTTISRWVEK